jgi:hypothetical protein
VNYIAQGHDLEATHGVTWGQMADLEPRLNELLWKARADGAQCRCHEEVTRVFGPVRNALTELIGFLGLNRDHPVLGSVAAYEVAYRRLYDAVGSLLHRPAIEVPDKVKVAPSLQSHRVPPAMEEAALSGELVAIH